MKKLLLLMLVLLILPMMIGFEFDNVKDYDEKTKTITITNVFGLGKEIAKITLDSPEIVYVIHGSDRLVAWLTINNNENYKNVFNDMEFFNKYTDEKIGKGFVYKYKIKNLNQFPYYKEVCIGKGNDTICSMQETGEYWYRDDSTWITIDKNAGLPKGEVTIGIFTDVGKRDNVEWISTLFGVRIDEWAVWIESLETDLLSWWDYQHLDVLNDTFRGFSNGTIFEQTFDLSSEGINGNCYLYNGAVKLDAGISGIGDFTNSKRLNSITDGSLSFWVNVTDYLLVMYFMGTNCVQSATGNDTRTDVNDTTIFAGHTTEEGKLLMRQMTDGQTDLISNVVDFSDAWNLDVWFNIIFTWNSTGTYLYINGNLNNSNTNSMYFGNATGEFYIASGFNASGILLDETAMWNRTLSPSEVSYLWDSGDGTFFIGEILSSYIDVSLISPEDFTNFTVQNIDFSSSSTVTNGNLTNTTFFLWYGNGTELESARETTIISGEGTNTTTINVPGLTAWNGSIWNESNYYWTFNTSANDTSQARITDMAPNKTFTIYEVFIDAEGYNEDTTEGNSETFTINVTTRQQITSADLIYNNTKYSGTLSKTGLTYNITKTISVDTLDANINLTFYWNFTMADGTEVHSITNNQSVINLLIDDCSTHTIRILNYTLKDEENQTILGGVSMNTSIEIDLDIYPKGLTTSILNFSKKFSQTNPIGVCLNKEAVDYKLYATAKYSSQDREIEYHHIQNATIKNTTTPINISLLDLATADSTAFQIIYKDTNFLPVEDALIDIQRQYVSEGLFKSVEIPKTDSSGQTVAHLVLNDIVYTILVSKYGSVLATFDNIRAFCEDTITGDCKINLNAFETGIAIEDWTITKNLDYTLSFDESTREIGVIFTTADGTSATVSVNTTKSDRWGNETVCSDVLISSSGTLSCVIPESYGNVSAITRIYINNELISINQLKIFEDRADYFGGTGIILLLMLIITIPLMLITSTIGVVLGSIFGLIIAGALMLYTGFSWFGTGSAIVFLIAAGAIIIYKIAERSKT